MKNIPPPSGLSTSSIPLSVSTGDISASSFAAEGSLAETTPQIGQVVQVAVPQSWINSSGFNLPANSPALTIDLKNTQKFGLTGDTRPDVGLFQRIIIWDRSPIDDGSPTILYTQAAHLGEAFTPTEQITRSGHITITFIYNNLDVIDRIKAWTGGAGFLLDARNLSTVRLVGITSAETGIPTCAVAITALNN